MVPLARPSLLSLRHILWVALSPPMAESHLQVNTFKARLCFPAEPAPAAGLSQRTLTSSFLWLRLQTMVSTLAGHTPQPNL